MEDYLNLYVSILSEKIGGNRNLTKELRLYIIFIYKEIYINMKEIYEKEGKNEEELKSDINKIFREAISEQNEGDIIKEMGNTNPDKYAKLAEFLRQTCGAKSRLRELLFGIELNQKNNLFPFEEAPDYGKDNTLLLILVSVDLNQDEIKERLYSLYIEGLKALNYNNDFNLRVFYGVSILVQLHSADQKIKEKYVDEIKLGWMDTRRAILGIFDVLMEIDSESCVIYGNSKLNELYTLKLGFEKGENFGIFEGLRSGKKITNNNELIEIKEQIEQIRLVNQDIFNKHLDEDQNFKNKFE
uniref:Hexosyltransferase n=1 Tax=Meloidogyne floridensis TaxID=298350 RepID=A0A915NXD9_9BILA